jgi:hypothetical protein
MRYTSGFGSTSVDNSFISTRPPVCKQRLRVGVGVKGRGVMVLVAVGGGVGESVGVVVRVAGGKEAVSETRGAYDGSRSAYVAVPSTNSGGTCPQAWIRSIAIRKNNVLLRTQAVYHNTPRLRSRLSLSETKLPTNPIQSFAGKIAREILQWRSECAS